MNTDFQWIWNTNAYRDTSSKPPYRPRPGFTRFFHILIRRSVWLLKGTAVWERAGVCPGAADESPWNFYSSWGSYGAFQLEELNPDLICHSGGGKGKWREIQRTWPTLIEKTTPKPREVSGRALAPLEVQEPRAAPPNHLVSSMPLCNPITPVEGALSCRVEGNTTGEERQILSVGDAATDCVFPTVLLRLPQTFGIKWDAVILWLYVKNNIIVFILIKKKKSRTLWKGNFLLPLKARTAYLWIRGEVWL